MKVSKLEASFAKAWGKYGHGKIPETQYRFSQRKFAFDFAWPAKLVAVECDGFGGRGFCKYCKQVVGGHQTILGLSKDHEKTNLASELGWTVLRYTSRQLGNELARKEAIRQVTRVLENRNAVRD